MNALKKMFKWVAPQPKHPAEPPTEQQRMAFWLIMEEIKKKLYLLGPDSEDYQFESSVRQNSILLFYGDRMNLSRNKAVSKCIDIRITPESFCLFSNLLKSYGTQPESIDEAIRRVEKWCITVAPERHEKIGSIFEQAQERLDAWKTSVRIQNPSVTPD